MPTHVQVVPCQEKQVIAKFVKKVPCPQAKPKKKQNREMPCPGSERRKPQGRVEGVSCPEMERRRAPKSCQQVVPCSDMERKKAPKSCQQVVPCSDMERKKAPKSCQQVVPCSDMERKKAPKPCQHTVPCQKKQVEKPPKCVQKIVPCSGEEPKFPPRGCPKCENNRIEKLECEVYKLRRELECMKLDRKAAEKAVGRAIIRGARALGGKYKPVVPDSIEKLLDSCESDASSQSTSPSITYCSTKNSAGPAVTRFCQNKMAQQQEDYCE